MNDAIIQRADEILADNRARDAARLAPAGVRIVVPQVPPTLNHMYKHHGSRRILTDEAWAFRQIVALACRGAAPLPAGALRFEMRVVFPDKRRRDVDNRIKAALDALEQALGFDDSRVEDMHISKRVEPGQSYCVLWIGAM